MKHFQQMSLVLTHKHKYTTWKMAFGGKRKQNINRTPYRSPILCQLEGIKSRKDTQRSLDSLTWLILYSNGQSLRPAEHLREKSHGQKEPDTGFYISSSSHLIRGTESSRCPKGLAGQTAKLRHWPLGLHEVRPGSASLWWPLGSEQHCSPAHLQTPSVLLSPPPNPPCSVSSRGSKQTSVELSYLPFTDYV